MSPCTAVIQWKSHLNSESHASKTKDSKIQPTTNAIDISTHSRRFGHWLTTTGRVISLEFVAVGPRAIWITTSNLWDLRSYNWKHFAHKTRTFCYKLRRGTAFGYGLFCGGRSADRPRTVDCDIIIRPAWQIGHPFSAAKRSLGLKLGRYVDWESLAKGCYGDVRSCYRWDARPSRTKWPKS